MTRGLYRRVGDSRAGEGDVLQCEGSFGNMNRAIIFLHVEKSMWI